MLSRSGIMPKLGGLLAGLSTKFSQEKMSQIESRTGGCCTFWQNLEFKPQRLQSTCAWIYTKILTKQISSLITMIIFPLKLLLSTCAFGSSNKNHWKQSNLLVCLHTSPIFRVVLKCLILVHREKDNWKLEIDLTFAWHYYLKSYFKSRTKEKNQTLWNQENLSQP